ncbi:MAG: 2-dehydropantoate 2-reductase [Gammaproteobacteria bacterium]|nr:2-dehydropantoate 2-reductase [Gammaproteobacteria bacterium]
MKICVVGAGSIGGLLGVRLSLVGEDVTLIARGPHLAAIRDQGLKLIMSDGQEFVARQVKATDDMHGVGPQDLVILGLKAHQIAPIAADVRSLCGPNTVVLTTQNGIPWWYFHKHGGPYQGRRLTSVDPDGVIGDNIDADSIVGCIAYPAAEIAEPGVIRHIEGTRFPVGELDGSQSERVKKISDLLIRAGFKSPILEDFRSELWLKLWGNLCFNPISALTHSTLVDICQFPKTRDLVREMMLEAQNIAHKLGVTFRVPLEKRIAGAEKVGKHKTSTLQDVEAGKPMEIEALIGAVVELGEITDTPTPYMKAVYACISLLGKTMEEEGIYIKGERIASKADTLSIEDFQTSQQVAAAG